jgi:hypothetical protein
VVLVLSGLALHLSAGILLQWQENLVETRLTDSEYPVTEVDFPAVTICSGGLDMMVGPGLT